ncbi:hypothetical protein Tco_1021372, partial [Tanacetum coccineum]
MSTPVFDPYEAIRKAYVDGTDTESKPFEDPIVTETLESPFAIAPPISLSESTSPVLIPILRRTARMVVRVPHVMSSGPFASMADVAAMSESALCKRFWSSYKSSPSVSPPDLLSRKRYRGTSELVEDSEEDEEIEESMDSDSVSEDAEDEGPTTEDDYPVTEDEGLTAGVEGPGMHDEGYGLDDERHGKDDEIRGIDEEGHSVESDELSLEEEEAVPEGQQQAASVVGTAMSTPLGLGYGALRRQSKRLDGVSAFRQPSLTTWTDPEDGMIYIDIHDYPPPAPPVQTPPSPKWTYGSLPISLSHSDVPSPISSPMEGLIRDHAVRLEELSPALFERYDRDIGELFNRSEAVRDEIFYQRPILALEVWVCQTDAQRAALRHVISDVQGENQDLRLQLAEERRARLELTEVIDGMKRGQEPRG